MEMPTITTTTSASKSNSSDVDQRFFNIPNVDRKPDPPLSFFLTTTTSTTRSTTIKFTQPEISISNNNNSNFNESFYSPETSISFSSKTTTSTQQPFNSHSEACGLFPPCNPLGCGEGIAPVDCPDCNSAAVGFALLGMCLLAILIVLTNVIVIAVISKNESLRRRHGYIKISLATADLLMGLLVIPAAIYNLATTLYLPIPQQPLVAAGRLLRPSHSHDPLYELNQENSLASVFFGTIVVISLTSSIYNLLLLSADRLMAIAKPMQTRTGNYLSNKKFLYCLIAVWFFGIFLSMLPALIPSHFTYRLDATSFFFIQSTKVDEDFKATGVAMFTFAVFGVPYIITVILNIVTLGLTLKKLRFSRKHSRRVRSDPSKRASDRCKSALYNTLKIQAEATMKLLKKAYPEDFAEENNNQSRFWKRLKLNFTKHTDAEECRDRSQSTASRSRSKSLRRSAKELNSRVTKMILTMVLSFTVCICPFFIVNFSLANGSLDCSNMGPVFNFSLYLLLFNSASNFFIYNLWHKEFRSKLLDSLKREPALSQKTTGRSSIVASTSSNDKRNIRHSSGRPPSSFARRTASHYHYLRKKKTHSHRSHSQQVFEQETHF